MVELHFNKLTRPDRLPIHAYSKRIRVHHWYPQHRRAYSVQVYFDCTICKQLTHANTRTLELLLAYSNIPPLLHRVRVQMLNGSMGEVRVEVEKRMARKVHTMELGMERRFLRGMVRFSLFVVLTPLTHTTLHAASRILSLDS